MRGVPVLAALLAACSGGSQGGDTQTNVASGTSKATCQLDKSRFGSAPLAASEPDAYNNVLAVGLDGPSWNGTAIGWKQAGMYVEILPQMDPRPTLHVKLDPKAECDTIDRLRKVVEQHCTARYCSIERTSVPPNGPRPIEY